MPHSFREGAYILQSSVVNDRPHWLKEDYSHGIWFDPKDAKWKIGTKNTIGNSSCSCSLQSNANALWPNEATNWAYDNYTCFWKCRLQHPIITDVFGSVGRNAR